MKNILEDVGELVVYYVKTVMEHLYVAGLLILLFLYLNAGGWSE